MEIVFPLDSLTCWLFTVRSTSTLVSHFPLQMVPLALKVMYLLSVLVQSQGLTKRKSEDPDCLLSSPARIPSPRSTPSTSSDPIAGDALTAHNSVRSVHGASSLTWNDDLAKTAQSWASGCVFEHSGGIFGGTSPGRLSLVVED